MGDASSSGYSSGVVGKVSPSVPPLPPVWCMDVHNKVLALGCKDGKIEVGSSGCLGLVLGQWFY